VNTRAAFGAVRLCFALLCLVSLVSRFLWGLGSATFTAGNFFAYLTMQSNIAFVIVSVIGGVIAFRTRLDPRWLTNLRALVLSCTLVAGLVFAVLVQQAAARSFPVEVPWSDHVLHFWLPALALIEWIVAPGRRRVQWRILPFVVGYPLVWGVVTLVRGASVGWYPYFFLDPRQVTDPVEFLLYSGCALGIFAAVSSGMVSVSTLRPLSELSLAQQRVIRRRVRASVEQTRSSHRPTSPQTESLPLRPRRQREQPLR
jgi:hypothetical protein